MRFYKLKNIAALCVKNIPGWRTKRKIIVIESDDWGSIRMPSREIYLRCLSSGYRVDTNPYERFDSLASDEDLSHLFEILGSFKDFNGKHPVITANVLVANPDFERIENSDYNEYHFELITDTFKKYPNHQNAFGLWKEGMSLGLFFPQSHGREHLNVSMFMNALRKGDPDARFGFKNHMPGSIPMGVKFGKNRYVEATNFNSEADKNEKLGIVIEGLDLFKKIFGFTSVSYIPTNYRWSPDFDEKISQKGVKFYQGNYKMIEPRVNGSIEINKYRLGERNAFQQHYLMRNVLFEPSLSNSSADIVSDTLRDISIAFNLNKPATICSHRLNFVGYLDKGNRDRNLKYLTNLLDEITKRWPDTEFMTSIELGNLISSTS